MNPHPTSYPSAAVSGSPQHLGVDVAHVEVGGDGVSYVIGAFSEVLVLVHLEDACGVVVLLLLLAPQRLLPGPGGPVGVPVLAILLRPGRG